VADALFDRVVIATSATDAARLVDTAAAFIARP
jgi:hypothetical protein